MRGLLPDSVLKIKEELIRDIKAGGNLNCSDCTMMEFSIFRGRKKARSRISTQQQSRL